MALAVAAAALVIGGCGGSGEDSDAAADGATTTVPVPIGEDGSGDPNGDQNGGTAGSGSDQLSFGDTDPSPGPDNRGTTTVVPVEPAELSDDDIPELAAPEELLPELEAEVGDAVIDAAESPDVAILDVADPPDSTPTDEEVAAFGDGNQRTPSGKLIVLDETASLACANVEIALGSIDEGDVATAADHIDQASQRSGRSEVDGIQGWSEALAKAGVAEPIEVTTLVGFLSVCIEGGYVM
jgi:hypothetical protein